MSSLVARKKTEEIANDAGNLNLKVSFLSRWRLNPYQELLVRSLRKYDAEISQAECKNVFLPNLLKSETDILHIQQVHPFFLREELDSLRCIKRLSFFIAQILLLKFIGIKLVWTVHDLKNHSNRHLKLDQIGSRFVAMFSDAIVVHCHAAKAKVIEKFGLLNTDKVHVVPHGSYVDYYEDVISEEESREKLAIPPAKTVFLFLGWVRPYKGVLELIETFKDKSFYDSFLIIAGKPYNTEINDLMISKTKNCENIKYFPGFVPNEAIQTYMNASDVVVLPYRDILTSGAVILAMSFSKACIAPKLCCIGETLDDSGAFLYESTDRNGLGVSMRRAIECRGRLNPMGKYNYQIAKKLDWQETAQATIDIYKSILHK